jgi:SWI/SNF-related matrix-associated actin-dependent regulator 1 of chromatin subfamily A
MNDVFIVNCERIRNKNLYCIRYFPNNQLTDRIKNLPRETRKWNPSILAWELTTAGLYNLIKFYKNSNKIHFDFGSNESKNIFIQQIIKIDSREEDKRKFIAELNIKKEEWVEYKKELEKSYYKYIDNVHKYLKSNISLYPHQVIGVMFLNVVRNVLLALDMGTGKSLISIAYVEMNDFKKVFVITPNSLKYNYYNEVEKFTNSNVYIIGKKNKCLIEDAKYIITNYEYFNSSNFNKTFDKFEKLNIGKIDVLICDESHRIKSNSSNTFKAIKKIFNENVFRNKKVSKIFMSGTPAPSKAAELYTVLNQISPIEFPTKKYFYEYYCGMSYQINGYGWTVDEENTKFEELFNKISPFTYRKKKSEVLKDLPEKSYQKVILEMTPEEYEIYYNLEEGIANEFCNREINNPLVIMGKLREYTSFLKINNVNELIDSILESNEKFVIIDYYKKSLYKLYEKYSDISVIHTGDQKDFERAEAVKLFQDENSKYKLFFGSENTTKEGLTLTAASKVGLTTMPWTPGTLDQCTDRVARIGQKNAVNAYLFIYKDTIDEYIFNLIEGKRSEITQVIDGEKYESDINQSIINDLINIIKKKHGK